MQGQKVGVGLESSGVVGESTAETVPGTGELDVTQTRGRNREGCSQVWDPGSKAGTYWGTPRL